MQIKQSAPLDWNKKLLISSHIKTRKVYFITSLRKCHKVIGVFQRSFYPDAPVQAQYLIAIILKTCDYLM